MKDMHLFDSRGPYEIPVFSGPGGRCIDTNRLTSFWKKHEDCARARGCYIFSMRAGRGITPIYVGKATKGFEQECLNPRNLSHHYNPALIRAKKGTPVIFFLALPRTKGKPNEKLIAQLEKFLIKQATVVNSDLSNVHGTKPPRWGIRGVLRSPKGKQSDSAKMFKQSMHF